MSIANVVAQSVLALLGIGVLGFWILKRGIIPENILGVLSTLAIDIALPSIVFVNIVLNFTPATFPNWWQLPLWWLFFSVVALCLALAAMFASAKSTRREFAVSLFFQNGLFFPLIILTGIFGGGTPYLAQLFIFIAFHPSLFFGGHHLFFRNGGGNTGSRLNLNGSRLNLKRIFNPVLIATLVAVIIRLSGGRDYLPDFLVSIFQILGGMTLPLVMLILGGSLYLDFQKKGRIYTAEIIKFVVLKNVLFPLVFLGILLLLRPTYNIALLLIIQSAVPPITGIPIITERMGGNRSVANQFILASFVVSIVSIPAVFALFNLFFPMP